MQSDRFGIKKQFVPSSDGRQYQHAHLLSQKGRARLGYLGGKSPGAFGVPSTLRRNAEAIAALLPGKNALGGCRGHLGCHDCPAYRARSLARSHRRDRPCLLDSFLISGWRWQCWRNADSAR